MKTNKETSPMDLLRLRKAHLDYRSEKITNSLLYKLEYGQENLSSILNLTLLEIVYPKLPVFLQKIIACKMENPDSNTNALKSGLMDIISRGIFDLLPFFLKGNKGILISFLLRNLKVFFNK